MYNISEALSFNVIVFLIWLSYNVEEGGECVIISCVGLLEPSSLSVLIMDNATSEFGSELVILICLFLN